jgi:hypothetical protein
VQSCHVKVKRDVHEFFWGWVVASKTCQVHRVRKSWLYQIRFKVKSVHITRYLFFKKTQRLWIGTNSGCTWKLRLPSRFLVDSLLKQCPKFGLLQGEKPRGWIWLDRTTMVFVQRYLFGGSVLENLVRSLGVVTTSGALAAVSVWCFDEVFFFVFVFFLCLCFCVFSISRLALEIILLLRLNIIGIILN